MQLTNSSCWDHDCDCLTQGWTVQPPNCKGVDLNVNAWVRDRWSSDRKLVCWICRCKALSYRMLVNRDPLVRADTDAGHRWMVKRVGKADDPGGREANAQGGTSQQRHVTEMQVSSSPISTAGLVTANVWVGEGQHSHTITIGSKQVQVLDLWVQVVGWSHGLGRMHWGCGWLVQAPDCKVLAVSMHAHPIETRTSNSLLHMVNVIWQVLMPNVGSWLKDAGADNHFELVVWVQDTDLLDVSWNIEGEIRWMGLSRAGLRANARLVGWGIDSVVGLNAGGRLREAVGWLIWIWIADADISIDARLRGDHWTHHVVVITNAWDRDGQCSHLGIANTSSQMQALDLWVPLTSWSGGCQALTCWIQVEMLTSMIVQIDSSMVDLRANAGLVGMGWELVVWCGSDAEYNWVARKWRWGSIWMDMKAEHEWAVAGCWDGYHTGRLSRCCESKWRFRSDKQPQPTQ